LNLARAKKILHEDVLEERPERKRRRPSIIAHALSGVIGSLTAELLLFPVDNIKLIIQTSTSKAGFLATLGRVLRVRGVAGLYKGISASLFKESVQSFNYWLWHGLLFRLFAKADDTSTTPTLTRLVLNLIAKQLNWLCTVPFEVVSTLNQLAPDSPGFLATAALMYEQRGVGAFYRGVSISLALAINPAIMNTLITSLLRAIASFRMVVHGQDYETSRDHGPAAIGSATAIAKFLATLGTYPLIRAKILQQTSTSLEQPTVLKIWRSVVAAEGMAGLYRGLLPMSYKTVCWNVVMMMFKHVLGPKRTITPPSTPPKLDPATLVPPMPWMGRAPFPAELITVDKLDEILSYVKLDQSHGKVQKLESRMNHMTEELHEVKHLLGQLVHHVSAMAPCEGQGPASL